MSSSATQQTNLQRKDSTQSSVDLEKSSTKEVEHTTATAAVNPPATITEEDERDNAGLHEYLQGRDLELTDADVRSPSPFLNL